MNAQTANNYFKLSTINGDLNKDGLSDRVIVFHDTITAKSTYKLEIQFGTPVDNIFEPIIITEKGIKADFPDAESIEDRFYTGEMFNEVVINKGLLKIRFNLQRGHYEHTYRYQNKHFELIGFDYITGDPDYLFSSSFNLSTGTRVVKEKNGKFKEKIKTEKILLKELPILGYFVPCINSGFTYNDILY